MELSDIPEHDAYKLVHENSNIDDPLQSSNIILNTMDKKLEAFDDFGDFI